MSTILSTTLRAAARHSGEPLNVLTFPTHEAYEASLTQAGHQFFAFRADGIKDHNKIFRPVPRNYTLLDPAKGEAQLPPDVTFDVVLSQNKLGHPNSQFGIAASLARSLHIPHVNIEHCLPDPNWSKGQILRLKQLRADYNVFISEFSRDAWLHDESEGLVIHHGLDTDLFCPPTPEIMRKPMLLSVVNDFVNRDWCCGFQYWKQSTSGLPCFVVGDTPGLSRAAATLDELIWRYQNASIFVNTSLVSPVPMALLEAMSCGCAVVSTNTCMIPNVITTLENGILCNSPDVMREWCEHLLENPEECRRLGDAARETIIDRFGLKRFVRNWNQILYKAARTLPQVRDPQGHIIEVGTNEKIYTK